MLRKMIRASLFAGFGMFAPLASYGVANFGRRHKLPDISTIMTKSFKGKTDSYKTTRSPPP